MIRLLSAAICLFTSAMSMATSFTPGMWEFEVRYTMGGMPTNVPKQSFRQCMQTPVPTVFLQARSCNTMSLKQRGRTVHYKLNCFTENGTLINQGSVRFAQGRARGSSRSELGDAVGRNSVMGYMFSARYLGACSTD